MKKIYTLLFICCLFAVTVHAQTRIRISGLVTDTAKTAITDATVMLISGKDTLKTVTDSYGSFSFKTATLELTLHVSIVGYETRSLEYVFSDKGKHHRVEPIQLSPSARMLEEVVIRGKPNPVRFMKDTVEYNAAAFQVMEGDNVADLLKQLPGMEVDENYAAKTMGKELTKLRVNGEDFFTSNVQDFISRLPAGIVDKIQVIDDFGDEANFTGIKTGEPQKMLNIVTKPGMNKGAFGNAGGRTGTNNMAGVNAGVNLWNKSKQSNANLGINTSDNGAGNTNSTTLGIGHRDKIGKTGRLDFNYNLSNNQNAFFREQVAESVNPEGGTFSSISNSNGENGGTSHNLGGSYRSTGEKWYINTTFSGRYNRTENLNTSINNQFGLIRQDLKNSSFNTSSAPMVDGGINVSKKFKNSKNSFSANVGFGFSSRDGSQEINTNTLYYDKTTGALQKDSLLRRTLENMNNARNLQFGFNYSYGLKNKKDSLARRSLNLNYSSRLTLSDQEVSTYVADNNSNLTYFVDSLSTDFRSSTFSHSIAAQYNYDSKKMRYNIGINARPNFVNNQDLRMGSKMVNNTFNYTPNINLSLTLPKGKTLSVRYSGQNINPTIHQLQPIRNTINLQSILVGNPDLKASFSHNLDGSYNILHQKSGRSIQFGLNANTTQRAIVDHIILIPDTLNSLKQLTRYENINGNYAVNGSYYINIPIFDKKHHLNYSGSAGISNQAIIFNNHRAFGKGLNFSQNLSSNIRFKKASLSARVGYSISNGNNVDQNRLIYSGATSELGLGQFNAPAFFRRTTFSSDISGNLNLKNLRMQSGVRYNISSNDGQTDQRFRKTEGINMNLSGNLTVKKSYYTNVDIVKNINYGYVLANTNPLLINVSVGKSFLKNKQLNCNIQGSDLLGQGNNISRTVSGNTILDQRSNQPTRVFSFNVTYRLSQFGGKHFVVHPD